MPYQTNSQHPNYMDGGMLPHLMCICCGSLWWPLCVRCGLRWHLVLAWPVVEPHRVNALTYGGSRGPGWEREATGNDQAISCQFLRQFCLKICHLWTRKLCISDLWLLIPQWLHQINSLLISYRLNLMPSKSLCQYLFKRDATTIMWHRHLSTHKYHAGWPV